MKNDQVMPNLMFMRQSAKWHLAYFLPIDGHFRQIVRYGLQICFTRIYSNFDIQSNFEVNQTQNIHFIPINTEKITKMAISQKPHFAQVSFTKKPTPPTFLNEFV